MEVDAATIAEAPEAIAHVENRIHRLRNDSVSFFKEFDEAMDRGLSIQDLLVVNSAQFPALCKHWDANGPAIPTELIEAFNAYKKAREDAQKPATTTPNEENQHTAQENIEMDQVHDESTASEGDAELSSAQATPMSQSVAIEEIGSQENTPEVSFIENESIKPQEEENTTEDMESITQEEAIKDEQVLKVEKEKDNEKEENGGNDQDKVEKEVKATKSERKLSDGVDTSGGSSNNTPQRVSSRIRNRLDQAAASSPKTPVVKQLTAEDFDSETDVVPLVNLRKRSAPSPSKAEAKSSESESPPKRTSARSRQKAAKEQVPPSRTSARNEAKLKKKKNEKNEDESEESEVTPSRRKSTRRTVTRKRKTDDSE